MIEREALTLALEALESCDKGDLSTGHVIYPSYDEQAVAKAITAIKDVLKAHKALAQPAVVSEQEPVMHTAIFHCPNCEYPHRQVTHIMGLAQPPWSPQRPSRSDMTWVGLDWNEMPEIYMNDKAFEHGAQWAEAKLKEKNL